MILESGLSVYISLFVVIFVRAVLTFTFQNTGTRGENTGSEKNLLLSVNRK